MNFRIGIIFIAASLSFLAKAADQDIFRIGPCHGKMVVYLNRGMKFFHLVEYEFVNIPGKRAEFRKIQQLSYGRQPRKFFLSREALTSLLVPAIQNYGAGNNSAFIYEKTDKFGILLEASKITELHKLDRKMVWQGKGNDVLIPEGERSAVWGCLRYFENPETYQDWIIKGESD
jgi:hypothetical protein